MQSDVFVFQAMYELRAFIRDIDRRIENAKKDLAETQEELSTDVEVKVHSPGMFMICVSFMLCFFTYYIFSVLCFKGK